MVLRLASALAYVGFVGCFRAIGRDTVRYNSFCGPLALPSKTKARLKLTFLGDSVVVNDLPEVPVTLGNDGLSVTVKMSKQLSSLLWETRIVTSWLSWWFAVFELTLDARLGVLVFRQSNDVNLVFSQDACKTRERQEMAVAIAPLPAISYLPPEGSFCGMVSSKSRDETVISFEEGMIAFSRDHVGVPFEMDGLELGFKVGVIVVGLKVGTNKLLKSI